MTSPQSHPGRERFAALIVGVGLVATAAFSCQHLHRNAVDAPPPEREDTAPPAATSLLAAAIASDGGMAGVVAFIGKDKGHCASVEGVLAERLRHAEGFAEKAGMSRALTVYLLCPGADAPQVFAALESSESMAGRDAGWRLAAARPSPAMAERISRRLSLALARPNLDGLATKQVANAIRENRVEDSYTFLRQALAVSGRGEFVQAMIFLDPDHARDDALAYLARALPEELRSSEVKRVDSKSCEDILAYFGRYPPPLSHPNFGHLFLYAVAQSERLSVPAQAVLTRMAGSNPVALAEILSKMARDVQLEYIVSLRNSDSAPLRILMREIRTRTPDAAVAAAIEQQELRR